MAVRVLRLEVPWVVRVSGHEVLRRDLSSPCRHGAHAPPAPTSAAGPRGALRAILLDEPEQDREADDHADGDGFDHLPEIRGDGGRDEQDEDEEVLELGKQHRPRRHPMHVAEDYVRSESRADAGAPRRRRAWRASPTGARTPP